MIKYDHLLKKGFSKQEAKRTVEIIQKAKKSKSPISSFLDSVSYWVLLLIAIIGNGVISILLIPFLLSFKKIPLYSIVFILAVMFGSLFDQLIRQIENLEKKRIIMAWVFIPSLAVISIYYMTSFTNNLTETLKLPITDNSPVLITLIYIIAFILPYMTHKIIEMSKIARHRRAECVAKP